MATREGSLIQRIRLVLDPDAKRKAAADAKAAGKEMGANIATGVGESTAQIRARVRAAINSGADVTLAGAGSPAKAAAAVATGLDKVTKTAPAAGGALARLREPLTAVASSALGANGTMGTLVSTLGMMAIGGGITGGVLAGIAAVGFAWDKLTAKTRAAKQATEEALAKLAGYRAAEMPQHDVAMTIGAGQKREQDLAAEIARLERNVARTGGLRSGGNLAGGMVESNAARRLREARGELTTVRLNIAAGQRELQRILADQREAAAGGGAGGGGRSGGAMGGGASGADAWALREAGAAARRGAFFDDRAAASAAAAGITGTFAGTNAGADLAASLFGAPSAESLIATVRDGLRDLDGQLADLVVQNPLQELRDAFAGQLAGSLAESIGAGFEGLFASGSLTDGFEQMKGAMLSGIGSAMMEFGKASLLASTLMQAIKKALASLNPAVAIPASLALIAGGAALKQLGSAASRSFGGMGGGGYTGYPGGTGGMGPQLAMADRGGTINIWLDQFDAGNPLHVEVMGRVMNKADERGLVRLNPGPRTPRRRS